MIATSSPVAAIATAGEDERHRQVAERGADQHPDVLAHDRLDHREHQHQERERAGDGEHGAVLALEPARREIGARRALDEIADLAGHPDGGVRDPRGHAAHDELAGRGGDAARGAPDGVADVADDRQVARVRDRPACVGAGGRRQRTGEDERAERAARAPRSAERTRALGSRLGTLNSSKRGMAANSSPGVRGDFRSGERRRGPGELANELTFQAPLSQTSETICVRHDCCGWTVAPLPTMPTYQTATVASAGREPLDPVADRDRAKHDHRPRDGVGTELGARLRARLLEGRDQLRARLG